MILKCLLAALLAAADAYAAEVPPAEPPKEPAAVPVLRDPYKDLYAAYRPDFPNLLGRGWEVTEKQMMLSSESQFFTLNMLLEDARANALVQAAVQKEAEGKYRDALKMYQMVVEKYPTELYRVSKFGVFVPVSQYCQRRILVLPPSDLSYYRTLYDARAKESFDLARQKYSLIGLSDVCDSMLATSYGGRALLSLGMSALDSGHYHEALEHFDQVWDFFPDPALRGAQLAMPMALCRKMLGQGQASGERYGLVGHWKLDEGSGKKAVDSSPSKCDGTIAPFGEKLPDGTFIEKPPNWTQGKVGGALHFDWSNAVSVPASTQMNVGVGGSDFSVAFWLKWESGSYPNGVFSKRGRSSTEMFNLEVTMGKAQLRYTIATQSPTWETGVTKRAIPAKTWIHVAFVKTGTEVKIFLDGKLDLRETLKAPALQNLGGVAFGQYIYGSLDDVRLYNRALLDREAAEFAGSLGATTMTAGPATGEAPLTVEFEKTGGEKAADTDILWEFGDGDTATGPKAKHTYKLGGEYTAVMTVTDANGAVLVARSKVIAKWPPSSEEFAKTMGGVLSTARYEKEPWTSQLASAPNIAPDDYTLFPPPTDPLAVNPPVWRATLPGSRRDFYVYSQPVVSENSVIYRHKNIVYCHSILNGELRWTNDLGGRAAWQNWGELQYPREDVLVQDGLVFTTVSKGGPSLVALDEVTGQLRWAYGPMVAATEEESRMRFEAAPAGGPMTVYAGYVLDNIEGDTHVDTEYGLMAFDSATGRLRWRTPLCRLAPGKFAAGFAVMRRNRIRSFTSPPLYHQGTLYYSTNAGSVAAVDALSGRILWLFRYPSYHGVHDSTRGFGGGHHYLYLDRPASPMFWYNTPPLLTGDNLYVTPVDTAFLFCVNRRNGQVRWTHARASGNIGHFMGPNAKGELVLLYDARGKYHVPDGNTSGPPLYLLDPDTGKVLWTSPDIIRLAGRPLMQHAFGIDLMYFCTGARPFMTSDNRLYVTSFLHLGWPYMGDVQHIACIDLTDRKIKDQVIFYSGPILGWARSVLYDPTFRWYAAAELKSLDDLPFKDERTTDRIAVLKSMIADTVPVNEHPPFFSFSRVTFSRHGVPFELRFGAREISMVYDAAAVRAALDRRTDTAATFARAELALAESRDTEAAALLKTCLDTVSSEDLDFRALLKQQLFRVHERLARSAIRATRPDLELEHDLGMSRTSNTLAEEIQTLFALSEVYERRGEYASAARCLRSIVTTYGHHEYPIAPIAADDPERVLGAAGGVLDGAAQMASSPIYGKELGASVSLIRNGLPLYLSTVSPLPKPLTVRAGELAARRLVRLQRSERGAEFARGFESEARKWLEGGTAAERLYHLWEFPGTASGQAALAALAREAAKLPPAASRQQLWQLADAARVGALELPEDVRGLVAPPGVQPPPAPLVLPPADRAVDLSDPEGVNWLVLERNDDLSQHPELLLLGGRVRKRLDNKFHLVCMDLNTGREKWERKNLRLKGTGQEPGFFEAFVVRDLVVVHGLYDVVAFDAGTGEPRWQFRGPFDFEIQSAALSGDLLVLSGKTETLALYVPTESPTGEVAWQVRELGDTYAAPWLVGDRLISVRKMPFNLTVRFRSTGRLIGRLELPDLSLHAAHPLVENGPEALPVAHFGDLLVVTDSWYYIAVDTARIRIAWKRLIDENDLSREPAMRFTLAPDHLLVLKENYDQKVVYLLDSRTGEVVWNTDPKDARSPQAMHSTFVSGDRIYGIQVHPGQGFYFAAVDLKSGKTAFRREAAGYQDKPGVTLLPRLYGEHAVALVADRQEFEIKVFDARTGNVAHTMKKKGVGPFGEHGRVSATVQSGRLVLLSKDDLSQ